MEDSSLEGAESRWFAPSSIGLDRLFPLHSLVRIKCILNFMKEIS